MAKQQTPKTVKEPSLPEKMIKFIHDNLKVLSIGLAGIAVIGLAIVGMGHLQKSKELKIESELFAERAKLTDLFQSKDDKDSKPAFETIQSAAKNFESKILAHSGSSAATTSAIELGGIYLDYKKYNMAKDLLTKIKPSSGVLGSLVNQQLATTLFELKDYKNAVDKLDKVISNKSDSFLHADALLKKGLAYKEMGDIDKAKASFQQVAEEYAEKPIAQTASKYLRVLNFKTK